MNVFLRRKVSRRSIQRASIFLNKDITLKYLGHGGYKFAFLVMNPIYGLCVKKISGGLVFVSKKKRFFTHVDNLKKDNDYLHSLKSFGRECMVWKKVNAIKESSPDLQFVNMLGKFDDHYYFEYVKPKDDDELLKLNYTTKKYVSIFKEQYGMADLGNHNFVGGKFIDFFIPPQKEHRRKQARRNGAIIQKRKHRRLKK